MLVKGQHIDGNPELSVAAWREGERPWQNADDRVSLVIQIHGSPHNLGLCAKALEPCLITQDYDICASGDIFAGIEAPPQHGMHTEGLKKAPAYTLALYRLRAGVGVQKIAAPAVDVER